VLNEVERNLHDAMGVARNVALDPRLVPGGGAVEMAIARGLNDKASTVCLLSPLLITEVSHGLVTHLTSGVPEVNSSSVVMHVRCCQMCDKSIIAPMVQTQHLIKVIGSTCCKCSFGSFDPFFHCTHIPALFAKY